MVCLKCGKPDKSGGLFCFNCGEAAYDDSWPEPDEQRSEQHSGQYTTTESPLQQHTTAESPLQLCPDKTSHDEQKVAHATNTEHKQPSQKPADANRYSAFNLLVPATALLFMVALIGFLINSGDPRLPSEQIVTDNTVYTALNSNLPLRSLQYDFTTATTTSISIRDFEVSVELTSLTIIDEGLTDCDIKSLSYMSNLRELRLSGNMISDISVLGELTNLEFLQLDRNQISDISALSSLTNLVTLNITNNLISDISALSELNNLVLLRLWNNQIYDISALSGLVNLESLSLWSNQISDITALGELTNLAYLSIRSNQIVDVSALFGLKNLEMLILWDNPICDEQIAELHFALPYSQIWD